MEEDSKIHPSEPDNEWRKIYEWEEGGLDPLQRAARFKGTLVHLTPQEFRALLALIEATGNTVPEETIYDRVWGITAVEANSVSKLMSRLRQKLTIEEKSYISAKVRGVYYFCAPVTVTYRKKERPLLTPLSVHLSASSQRVSAGEKVVFACEPQGGLPPYQFSWEGYPNIESETLMQGFSTAGRHSVKAEVHDALGNSVTASVSIEVAASTSEGNPEQFQNSSKSIPRYLPSATSLIHWRWRAIMLLLIGIGVLGAALSLSSPKISRLLGGPWLSPQVKKDAIHSLADETEIRRVVYDSQMYETLVLYKNPASLDRKKLDEYWVPKEKGGRAVLAVELAVQRQVQRKLRYGPESKCESFEVLHVTVLSPGDYAEVRTREHWYLPTYREDGTRVSEKSPFYGPYQLDYTLRKINGKWLIQSTSTPYSQ